MAKHKIKRTKISRLASDILSRCVKASTEPLAQKWNTYLEVYNLIQELRKCEPDFKPPKREDNWNSLIKWAKDNGAFLDLVEINKVKDNEYTLITKQDLKEGDLVLEIPQKLVLSSDLIKDSKLRELSHSDPILSKMTNIQMALLLLAEHFDETSFWKPYIDTLPGFHHNVLYYTPEEMQVLRCSPAFEDALNHFLSIARQYAYFYRLFQNSSDSVLKDLFCYDAYRWATSSIMSRVNNFHSDDKKTHNEECLALIPIFDLCNHTFGKISTSYDFKDGAIKSLAMEDKKAGEPLYIFYGKRTNRELLIHGGFVYEENQDDYFILKLGVGTNDKLKESRHEICKKMGINGNTTAYHLLPQEIDPSLLTLVCILTLNKDECNFWCEQKDTTDFLTDNSLVTKGLNYLITRLKILQRGYLEEPTSGDISNNFKLASRYIALEGKLLEDILNYFQQIQQQVLDVA